MVLIELWLLGLVTLTQDWRNEMKTIGFVLMVVGVLALLYGGISYSRQKTIIDVGSFKATATEQKNIPLSPIIGGIALLGGILLIAAQRKRAA